MSTREIVIHRLVELGLVKDAAEAECWFLSEVIPAFMRTGNELVEQGDSDALLEELERIADDGFA